MIIKFNIVPSTPDARDFDVSSFLRAAATSADSVDYSSQLLPVRNQGTQGSCAAMSGAAMKEWQERSPNYLSPQFIYNNRANIRDDDSTNDDGMSLRDLMKILKTAGVCSEDMYRYGRIESKDLIPADVCAAAKKNVISTYARITTIEDLRQSLLQNGPCIVAVPVYNHTPTMWLKEPGDVFLGGHAMCVVGFDADALILRNSWGENWGDNGYCRMPLENFSLAYEFWTSIDDETNNFPRAQKKRIRWKKIN